MTPKTQKRLTPIPAMRARCLNCTGNERATVRRCVHTDCQLWPYRMGHRPQEADGPCLTPLKAIRRYCLWCGKQQPSEVRRCPANDCPLWAYRMGRRPLALEATGDLRGSFSEAEPEDESMAGSSRRGH
jgi:hypothetical protein